MAAIYLTMVMCLISFARAVCSADWNLCLSSLDCFGEYCLRNYSAMSALHIAEMHDLNKRDRETWEELSKGAWAPYKNDIPFYSLGADKALEQENRRMKVSGGVMGITHSAQTLPKCFLLLPELYKISRSNSSMVMSHECKTPHHELWTAVSNRSHTQVFS